MMMNDMNMVHCSDRISEYIAALPPLSVEEPHQKPFHFNVTCEYDQIPRYQITAEDRFDDLASHMDYRDDSCYRCSSVFYSAFINALPPLELQCTKNRIESWESTLMSRLPSHVSVQDGVSTDVREQLEEGERKYQIFIQPITPGLIKENASPPLTANASLRQSAKAWITKRRQFLSAAVVENNEAFVNNVLSFSTIGACAVKDLKKSEIQEFVDRVRKDQSASAAIRAKRMINSIIRYGNEQQITNENVCTAVTVPLYTNDHVPYLTDPQLKRFFAVIENHPQWNVMGFMACTGTSAKETVALRQRDLDRRHRILHVSGTFARCIPISAAALSYVPCCSDPDAPLFATTEETAMKPSDLSSQFVRLRSISGIKCLNATVLRNTFSLKLASFCEGKEIQDYFGQPNCSYALRMKDYYQTLKSAGLTGKEKTNHVNRKNNSCVQPYLPC